MKIFIIGTTEEKKKIIRGRVLSYLLRKLIGWGILGSWTHHELLASLLIVLGINSLKKWIPVFFLPYFELLLFIMMSNLFIFIMNRTKIYHPWFPAPLSKFFQFFKFEFELLMIGHTSLENRPWHPKCSTLSSCEGPALASTRYRTQTFQKSQAKEPPSLISDCWNEIQFNQSIKYWQPALYGKSVCCQHSKKNFLSTLFSLISLPLLIILWFFVLKH